MTVVHAGFRSGSPVALAFPVMSPGRRKRTPGGRSSRAAGRRRCCPYELPGARLPTTDWRQLLHASPQIGRNNRQGWKLGFETLPGLRSRLPLPVARSAGGRLLVHVVESPRMPRRPATTGGVMPSLPRSWRARRLTGRTGFRSLPVPIRSAGRCSVGRDFVLGTSSAAAYMDSRIRTWRFRDRITSSPTSLPRHGVFPPSRSRCAGRRRRPRTDRRRASSGEAPCPCPSARPSRRSRRNRGRRR